MRPRPCGRPAPPWRARAMRSTRSIHPPSMRWPRAGERSSSTRCANVSLPYIRQHGGADLNRCVDLILENTPDVGLEAYIQALAERTRHVRDWLLFLERYPLVVGPVSTEPPFRIGFDTTSAARTAEVARAQRLLVAVNLLGFPAVSVPSDRKSTRLNSSHLGISYAVFCLKKQTSKRYD